MIFCLVFVMLSRLFIAALWSLAGKGLTSWLSFVILNCVFVTLPCGILGQHCYLIVSIPDHCRLSYFNYQSCFVCAMWRPVKVSPHFHLMLLLFQSSACTITFAFTITFHYSLPWMSLMSCTAFKITR